MSGIYQKTMSRTVCEQMAEDPDREPHEKETAIHLEGDSDRATVTSFKKVVFSKLVRLPEFELRRLIVRDSDGRERSVESYSEVLDNPDLTIIGVYGTVPVGTLSIGTARIGNSHSKIVKP